MTHLARRSALLALVLANGCSDKPAPAPASSASPSSATSSVPSARPSAKAPTSAPPPTAPARLACPDDFYQSESPLFCVKLEQARPGRAEPDGAWFTSSIGAGASLSTSRTKSVEDTVKEVRDAWGTDALKERSQYKEETDSGRTILRFKRFDPKDDPKATEAKDVVVVVAKSGDTTLRCEVSGDMSPPSVCLSLVVPP